MKKKLLTRGKISVLNRVTFLFTGLVLQPPGPPPQTGPILPALGLQPYGPLRHELCGPPLRHVRRSRRRHGRRILLKPGVCLVQRRRRRVHAHLIAGPELALLDAELCGDVCVPVLPGELPPLLLNHVITRQPLRITLHRRKLVVERTARLTGKIIHV